MGIIRHTYYGDMTKEVLLCSIDSLLDLTSSDVIKVYVVPTSREPCEKCSQPAKPYTVLPGQRVGDVLPKDKLPPFHPHCRCKIILKVGDKEHTIDASELESGRVCILVRVPREVKEIQAGSEKQFLALKKELEVAYNNYMKELTKKLGWHRWGPTDNILDVIDFLRISDPHRSCEDRANDIVIIFDKIISKLGAQDFVNLQKIDIEGHVGVLVEISYMASLGRIKKAKGFFDPWLEKEKGLVKLRFPKWILQ